MNNFSKIKREAGDMAKSFCHGVRVGVSFAVVISPLLILGAVLEARAK